MPIASSSYVGKPFWMWNEHIETIYPSLFRTIELTYHRREHCELADGDFLAIDYLTQQSNRVVIISHGLEGGSHRHYVTGMARYFYERKWDVMAWNCRSCNGEMNRTTRLYHHGATDDLQAVVQEALKKKYTSIALVGFSLGGNLTLKYLGEGRAPSQIKSAVAFSVPCHLPSCAALLDQPNRWFYRQRFLSKLKEKIKMKAKQFPDVFSVKPLASMTTLRQFDDTYTAPLHGFSSAADYYEKTSSGQFIASIQTPTLLVNAANDPFLTEACFPIEQTRQHPYVQLEIPPHGGHVGFSLQGKKENWMDVRAYEFINS